MQWDRTNTGKVRYIIKFAWMPTETATGTVWLENYFVKEVFRRDGERWGEGIVCVAIGDGWYTEGVFAQSRY